MQSLRVFCFLWDDPLFADWSNADAWGPQHAVVDPEFIALHRQERLLALEVLYIRIAQLQEHLAFMRKMAGRGTWMWKQLIDHVPTEVRERVLIESQVNAMDPDFSWVKAISNKE